MTEPLRYCHEGIEFGTSRARSPPCPVDHNRNLSHQLTQRIMNPLCSLNKSLIVRLTGDYLDTGQERAHLAL